MGVLKVRVNDTWESVTGEETPPEVFTGTAPPDPILPYSLWVDVSTDPPRLKAKDPTGAWQDISAPDEVFISPDEPIDPATEFWFDTDAPADIAQGGIAVPPGGTTGQALIKTSDVDGEAAWGGLLDMDGQTIQFANTTGDKIHLYSADFGLGVNSGETVVYGSGKVGFRDKGFDGTQWGYVDSAGFVQGARRVHVGKFQGTVNLTSGAWYRVGYAGGAGGGRFSVVALAGGDCIQSVSGSFSAMNIGGIGFGRVGVAANCKDGTAPFNRIGISWSAGQYCMNFRAARTVSVTVGFEVTNSNGDMSPASWENDGGDFYGGVDI